MCQTTVERLAPPQGVAPVAGLHKAGSLLLQENCHPPPPPSLLLCLLNGPERVLRGTARNCRLCESPEQSGREEEHRFVLVLVSGLNPHGTFYCEFVRLLSTLLFETFLK